jgi:hypothetical protein
MIFDKNSKLLDIISVQSYFLFNLKQYKQTNGPAMGAPTSSFLAESLLQYLEHNQIRHILLNTILLDILDM